MSTQALATNWGKVIDQRDANHCKVSYALERKRESEGYGFKSQGQERIFFTQIYVKVELVQPPCYRICTLRKCEFNSVFIES